MLLYSDVLVQPNCLGSTVGMRKLHRLHIRPYGGHADHPLALAYCMERSVIGMGWSLPDEPVKRSTDFEWYKAAASTFYKDRGWYSVWAFHDAEVGDLVWFRNLNGRYYVAELTGPWNYAYDGEDAINADIVNYRTARIVEVGLADAVPGKIISCFRPSRTFQSIVAPGMLAYSARLAGVELPSQPLLDLYEFMSDSDIENLVFVYLQAVGWYVLPGTRMVNTAHYEFVLVNRDDGERAIVQVKSGRTSLDAAAYEGEQKAFLFASSGDYGLGVPGNVVIISRHDLDEFILRMPNLLPQAVRTWATIVAAG